jgi:hypothetical protein
MQSFCNKIYEFPRCNHNKKIVYLLLMELMQLIKLIEHLEPVEQLEQFELIY